MTRSILNKRGMDDKSKAYYDRLCNQVEEILRDKFPDMEYQLDFVKSTLGWERDQIIVRFHGDYRKRQVEEKFYMCGIIVTAKKVI